MFPSVKKAMDKGELEHLGQQLEAVKVAAPPVPQPEPAGLTA